MRLDFAREPWSLKLLGEMTPLVVKHFQEIARFKDFRIEPNFDHYSALEKNDILRIYTARREENLVGYAVFNLFRHPHFLGRITAQSELLFLDPLCRKGNLGDKLIEYADLCLAKDGADVIYHSVSVERDYSLLLLRKGYELSDRIYAKRFGGKK